MPKAPGNPMRMQPARTPTPVGAHWLREPSFIRTIPSALDFHQIVPGDSGMEESPLLDELVG